MFLLVPTVGGASRVPARIGTERLMEAHCGQRADSRTVTELRGCQAGLKARLYWKMRSSLVIGSK